VLRADLKVGVQIAEDGPVGPRAGHEHSTVNNRPRQNWGPHTNNNIIIFATQMTTPQAFRSTPIEFLFFYNNFLHFFALGN